MRPYRPFVFVAALIGTVYLVGWLSYVDRGLTDARAHFWSRDASGDLVVVAIDPASLNALRHLSDAMLPVGNARELQARADTDVGCAKTERTRQISFFQYVSSFSAAKHELLSCSARATWIKA